MIYKIVVILGLIIVMGCDIVSDRSEPNVLHPTDECYSSAWHAGDVPSAGVDPIWELFCEGKVWNADH